MEGSSARVHGKPRRRTRLRRIAAVLAAVVAVVAVLAIAVVFANGESARRVAENATLLHWTNAAQGSAGLARAASGQAVLFGLSTEVGAAETSSLDQALAEADASLASFNAVARELPPEVLLLAPTLDASAEAFSAAAADVNDLVRQGDHIAANDLRHAALDPAYLRLSSELMEAQGEVEGLISENENSANVTAQAIRLLVTLIIPAAALIAYWLIARRQLRDNRIELETRLEAEHQMVAGVSHELRTPLTAIYGFSESMLELGMTDPDEVRDVLTVINSEAADLTRMVDDLLVVAQLESSDITLSSSEFSVVDEIESIITPFIRTGYDVSVECWPGTASTDRVRFRQVVKNLVSNAARHGGPSIVILGEIIDGRFECSVADDGPGVSPEVEARLFEPFVNSGERAVVSGSVGLGLSVSKAIAERMGGALRYSRTEDLTVFTFSLPAEGWIESEGESRPVVLRPSQEDAVADDDDERQPSDDRADAPDDAMDDADSETASESEILVSRSEDVPIVFP